MLHIYNTYESWRVNSLWSWAWAIVAFESFCALSTISVYTHNSYRTSTTRHATAHKISFVFFLCAFRVSLSRVIYGKRTTHKKKSKQKKRKKITRMSTHLWRVRLATRHVDDVYVCSLTESIYERRVRIHIIKKTSVN